MFAGYTTADLGVSGALMVALSGIVVVFLMLAVLFLLITVISKVVGGMEGKKADPAPAQKAAPAAAPVAAAPAQDEDELVAVLMAAIAAESDSSPDSFRITSVESR